MEFKEVHKGIDSLYLSYRGVVRDEALEELIKKKELAQSDDDSLQAMAQMPIDEHCFEVSDKGRRSYAFVLIDGWFQIQVSASKRRKIPEVYVQISSALLNCMGLDNALNDLRNVVSKLLLNIEEESVSRADLFVDFASGRDFSKIKDEEWITRAHDISRHSKNRVFTGFSIGMGGDIVARLYDKTIEIAKSNKLYFHEIWEKQGWSGEKVWRTEFQLRRAFLKEMSVNTIADLLLYVNDVWRYCTNEWLRLGIDNGTENRSRWPTDELWKEIQRAIFGDGSFTGITRNVDKSRAPDDKTLFKGGIGYITSHAAKNGIENLDDAVSSFAKDAKRFLDRFEGSNDYFKTKLELKKKRFNKGNDNEDVDR